MVKRAVLAVVAVFIAWAVLDYIIHPVILGSGYKDTAHLWRPPGEMKRYLMYVVSIVAAAAFVSIYAFLIRPRCIGTGLQYGVLFGLAMGVPMGYATYCVMPIPHYMALVWLLGTIVEMVVGGLLVGAIVKEVKEKASEGQ